MTAADFDIGVGSTLAARSQQRIGAGCLFALLCAFTLTTMDGGDVAPRLVSAVLLLAGACYFSYYPGLLNFEPGVPAVCLLGMTCWGLIQILFSRQKIFAAGCAGILFWFTAAVIVLVSASAFENAEATADFRRAFVMFASAVSVLDLVQQASGANRFFWLIPSRYDVVFGPFAYWNSFAEFIELSLPMTLWQGLSKTQPKILYLLLSALQVCAVIASGSRAGSILVMLELIAVVIFVYFRKRSRNFLLGASATVVLSMLFVYAAGFSTVVSKLQESDQLAVRRNINRSSLAMLAVHPITGWGLETYVPVYRMFALYDDGTYVNRAHNDWLQFAVEGGVPFAGLFAAIVLWSIRPAVRSVWGIGVVAIALHALVDYPFARFGVSGWYFALLGMFAYQRIERPLQPAKPLRGSIF